MPRNPTDIGRRAQNVLNLIDGKPKQNEIFLVVNVEKENIILTDLMPASHFHVHLKKKLLSTFTVYFTMVKFSN